MNTRRTRRAPRLTAALVLSALAAAAMLVVLASPAAPAPGRDDAAGDRVDATTTSTRPATTTSTTLIATTTSATRTTAPPLPWLAVKPDKAAPGDHVRVGGGGQGCDQAGNDDVGGFIELTLLLDAEVPVFQGTVALQNRDFAVDVELPQSVEAGDHLLVSRCAVRGANRLRARTPITVTPASEPTSTSNSSAETTASPPTAGPAPGTTIAPPTTARPAPSTTTGPAATTEPASPTTTSASTDTTTPPMPTPPTSSRSRSAFPEALPSPGDISFAPSDVVRSLGLAALLMLLVGFPAELFNKTVEENYDELSRWLTLGNHGRQPRRGPAVVILPAFAAVAALFCALLDPGITDDRASLALLIGLFVAVLIVTLTFELPATAYARTRVGGAAHWRVFPKALVFAGMCVVISRLASFQPGYVYGLIAGYVLARTRRLSTADAGRSTALGALALLVVSAVTWALWIPVDHRIADSATRPSLALLIVDAALSAVFIAGIEGLTFALVPLRFLDGETLARWSRPVWLILWATSTWAFVHVLLDPKIAGIDPVHRPSLAAMLVPFVAFGGLSILLWAYFVPRRRRGRITTSRTLR